MPVNETPTGKNQELTERINEIPEGTIKITINGHPGENLPTNVLAHTKMDFGNGINSVSTDGGKDVLIFGIETIADCNEHFIDFLNSNIISRNRKVICEILKPEEVNV